MSKDGSEIQLPCRRIELDSEGNSYGEVRLTFYAGRVKFVEKNEN